MNALNTEAIVTAIQHYRDGLISGLEFVRAIDTWRAAVNMREVEQAHDDGDVLGD